MKEEKLSFIIAGCIVSAFFVINFILNENSEKPHETNIEQILMKEKDQQLKVNIQEKLKNDSVGNEKQEIDHHVQNEVAADYSKKEYEETKKIEKAIDDLDESQFEFEEDEYNNNYSPQNYDIGPASEITQSGWLDEVKDIAEPIIVPEIKGIEIPDSKNITGASCDSSAGKYLPLCNP